MAVCAKVGLSLVEGFAVRKTDFISLSKREIVSYMGVMACEASYLRRVWYERLWIDLPSLRIFDEPFVCMTFLASRSVGIRGITDYLMSGG